MGLVTSHLHSMHCLLSIVKPRIRKGLILASPRANFPRKFSKENIRKSVFTWNIWKKIKCSWKSVKGEKSWESRDFRTRSWLISGYPVDIFIDLFQAVGQRILRQCIAYVLYFRNNNNSNQVQNVCFSANISKKNNDCKILGWTPPRIFCPISCQYALYHPKQNKNSVKILKYFFFTGVIPLKPSKGKQPKFLCVFIMTRYSISVM